MKDFVISIIRKIKERPLGSFVKAINPIWWWMRVTDRIKKVKRSDRSKKDIKESEHVFEMLMNMYEGKFQDATYYRDQKLLQILNYADRHCSYYKKVFNQVGFNPEKLDGFESLPLLDKAIIRCHQNELISDEIDLLDFYTMNTGGSTGEPLEFVVSRLAGLIDKVHQEFVYRTTMNYQVGDVTVGFGGSSVPANFLSENKYWVENNGQDIPYSRLKYSSLYLRADTISYYIKHFLETKPKILRGYPSFINDIAEYILAKNIPVTFHINGIQLTAENVYDWQVENIRKAFNTKVFFQYGHSEACVYGYTFDDTCEYHCSPFYGLTEVLDEEGKQVRQGKVGEIVVTGFSNFAMPFIRYRTGDMALFNGDDNGIVRLGKIIGRTQDYIYGRNKEKIALTALIFGQHYRAFKNIRKWQVQQDYPGKIIVKIVKDEGFSEENENEIRSKFRDICTVDTEFAYVDLIPLTQRGKFKFLVQNIQA